MTMGTLALFVELEGRDCLVVGGGEAAHRRVNALRDAGARVVVVAPRATPGLAESVSDGNVIHHPRRFEPTDLDGIWLAVATTGLPEVDGAVADAAAVRNVPCEAAASPAGSCRLPATIDRGPVRIAAAPITGAKTPAGRVDLVGAGPGDPGLLTLDALAALQRADVVLHDRLVADEVLALAPPEAERHYVGKARARHSYEQGSLNELMVELARIGRHVVRLKGGDPFIFGRGGEEATAIAAAGIPVRVIPGITAAGGCAAYAGIPLTHRDYAHSCQFITARRRHGAIELDREGLARQRQTLAIYMGLSALSEVCDELTAAGLAPTTPAALVERGTLTDQRVLTGTLADLPEQARPLALRSPTLLIVGEVVRLRAALHGKHDASPPVPALE